MLSTLFAICFPHYPKCLGFSRNNSALHVRTTVSSFLYHFLSLCTFWCIICKYNMCIFGPPCLLESQRKSWIFSEFSRTWEVLEIKLGVLKGPVIYLWFKLRNVHSTEFGCLPTETAWQWISEYLVCRMLYMQHNSVFVYSAMSSVNVVDSAW